MKKEVLLFILLLTIIQGRIFAQNPAVVTGKPLVTGKVVDSATGQPVVGASVTVVGSKKGTVTDNSGAFRLNAPSSAILVISDVRYAEMRVPASGALGHIQLRSLSRDMSDVIVVGYGTRKKEVLTGAISQVGEEVFKDRPVPNVELALQGSVPGLVITRTSTRPGNEGLGIVLRGASSVVAVDPLIIIDGVPVIGTWELSQINPNDVQSVSVLKDASAAIYGSRAQGGVILVTTKRGRGNKMQVTLNTTASLNTIGIKVPWANMSQWAKMYLQTSFSDKRDLSGNPVQWLPQWTLANLNKMSADSSFDYTDPGGVVHHYADNNWQHALYGPAWSTQQNVSIRGSSGKAAYMLSLGYSDDKSLLKTAYDGEQKYTVRMNYDYTISEKVKFESGFSFDDRIVKSPRNGIGTGYFDAPIFPTYNKLGEYYDDYGYRNPVAITKLGGTTRNSEGIVRLNAKLTAEIIDGLKLTGTAALTKRDGWMTAYNQTFNFYNWLGTLVTSTQYGPPNNPSITETIGNTLYQVYGGQLDYNKTIAQDHHLSAMVGTTAELSQTKNVSATRSQLQFAGLYDLNTAISPTNVSYANENSGGNSQWGFVSYLSRIDYDYQQKYLLTLLGRRDGTSKFDVGYKWSNFYGVLGGWRITQENFMKELKWLNELKIRASYGRTGGQVNIGNYDFVSTISQGTALFGSTPALQNSSWVTSITTNQRTWETVVKKNLGFDFGVLSNRLTGSVEIFENKNIGMLISLNYPAILGGKAPTTNSGDLRTRGWEMQLNWRGMAGSVTYNIGVNLSNAKNIITHYAGANLYAAGKYTTPREGYPLNSLYVYKTDGYFKTQAEADAYFAKYGSSGAAAGYNGTTNTFHPGDLKVVDLDGNGIIKDYTTGVKGSGDVYFAGDADPHYTFGVNLGAGWHGLDFSAFIQGVAQWKILRTGNARAPFFRNYLNVNTTYIGKTWTPDNPNAPYPRLSFDNNINNWNWQNNDVNIQHLRYARLKSLILGYTLPGTLTRKAKFDRVRVYFSGNDLFELTSVRDGFDPERGESSDNSYPFFRTWAFGLDLGF